MIVALFSVIHVKTTANKKIKRKRNYSVEFSFPSHYEARLLVSIDMRCCFGVC